VSDTSGKPKDAAKQLARGAGSGVRGALRRFRPNRITEEPRERGELTSRAVVSVDTSTAAFVGAPAAGAPSQPVELTSFVDYERAFGSTNGELGRAVRLFFENGGTRAWAVRGSHELADGLRALGGVPFSLLALPDSGGLDPEEAAELAVAANETCGQRQAFLLVDPPASLAPADVEAWTGDIGPASNAAVYVPRLRLADGSETAASGAVAGIIARTDRDRGVWRAAAGSTAGVRGVADVTVTLTEEEVDRVTTAGVNVIRPLPRGLVLWGARTLALAQPEWRYVNVRRLALFLERSIREGTRWAAFEPNDDALWSEVRGAVDEFMLTLFQQGAFGGRTPEDAYFVRCDRLTMTQDDIDAGRLIIRVGFAPVPPTEFISLRIG
jgi:phage tail sheath protein FI